MTEHIQPDLFGGTPAPAYLFFDTETTGLPKSWRAPVTDLANWPRLVQLAYIAYDAEGNQLASMDTIVKPVGFTIPEEASKVHGITTERALRDGRDLAVVLNEFRALLDRTKYLIAHNMGYDEKIIGAEFLRNGMTDIPASIIKICTMHSTTEYCEIPGSYGYKWPKLMELHQKLFEVEFEGAHDALADVAATAKCFWELKKRGVIKA